MLDNKKYTAILDLEEKGFVSSANRASASLHGLSSHTGAFKGLAESMGHMKHMMAGMIAMNIAGSIINGFTGMATATINYNAMLEQSGVAWKTLLGTQKEAVATQKLIQKIASKTPFDFEGIDSFAKKLTLANLGGKDLERNIKAVADAVSAVGGSTDTFDGVGTALAQMSNKGKITAEEMQQLAERGVDGWGMLAKSTGKTKAELMKMSQDGLLPASKYLPELISGMEKSFGGASAEQAKTFNGLLNTTKDTLKEIGGLATAGLFDSMKGGLEGLQPILTGIKDAFKDGGFIGVIKKYMPTALPFIQDLGNVIKSTFTQIQGVATVFQSFWAEHGALITSIMKVAWFLILAVIQSVINSVIGVVKNGLSLIDGIIDLFSNLFKGNFKGAWESIKQIFTSAVGLIWNIMNLMFLSNLKTLFTAFKTGTVNIITSLWTGLKSIFSGGVTGVINFIKNLVTTGASNFNMLKTFGASSFQALFSVGRTMVGNLLNAVKSTMGLVPTTIRNLMNTAIGVLKNINLFSIGKNMIQGLINGIKNMLPNIKNAMAGLAGTAKSTAEKKLDIHSPSRVFKQLGEYTGQGYAIGISNTERDTKNAIKSLTGSAINSVAEPQTYSSGNASFVLNINNPSVRNDQDINALTKQIDIKLKEFESRNRRTRGGVSIA